LNDGRVLLTGGNSDNGNATNTAVLFDPTAGTFASAGTMAVPHSWATATTLADGSVLVAGGEFDGTCCYAHPPQPVMERFIPGTGWVSAGSMIVSRSFHEATLLANGQVLFTGSFGWASMGARLSELYDPAAAISLVSASAPPGQNGVAYAGFTLAGQGGNGGPYTIVQASGALPPGLFYSSGTKTVSGTPTQSGTYVAGFSVSDGAGHSNTQSIAFRIDALTITSPDFLGTAFSGSPFSVTLTSSGGVGAVTWSIIANTPPPGLSLSGNAISGTATVSCCYYGFTVQATDSIGQTTRKALGIAVQTSFDEGWLLTAIAPERYDASLAANVERTEALLAAIRGGACVVEPSSGARTQRSAPDAVEGGSLWPVTLRPYDR
jgi:hypothetical protein